MPLKRAVCAELTEEEIAKTEKQQLKKIKKDNLKKEEHRIRRELFEKVAAMLVAMSWGTYFDVVASNAVGRTMLAFGSYSSALMLLKLLARVLDRMPFEQFSVFASQFTAVLWRDASNALFIAVVPLASSTKNLGYGKGAALLGEHFAWAAALLLFGISWVTLAWWLFRRRGGVSAADLSPDDPRSWVRKGTVMVAIETVSCAAGYGYYMSLHNFFLGMEKSAAVDDGNFSESGDEFLYVIVAVLGVAVAGGVLMIMRRVGVPAQSATFLVFLKSVGYSSGMLFNMAFQLVYCSSIQQPIAGTKITGGALGYMAMMLTVGIGKIAKMRSSGAKGEVRTSGAQSTEAARKRAEIWTYMCDVLILSAQICMALSVKGVLKQVIASLDDGTDGAIAGSGALVTSVLLTVSWAGVCIMTAFCAKPAEVRDDGSLTDSAETTVVDPAGVSSVCLSGGSVTVSADDRLSVGSSQQLLSP